MSHETVFYHDYLIPFSGPFGAIDVVYSCQYVIEPYTDENEQTKFEALLIGFDAKVFFDGLPGLTESLFKNLPLQQNRKLVAEIKASCLSAWLDTHSITNNEAAPALAVAA